MIAVPQSASRASHRRTTSLSVCAYPSFERDEKARIIRRRAILQVLRVRRVRSAGNCSVEGRLGRVATDYRRRPGSSSWERLGSERRLPSQDQPSVYDLRGPHELEVRFGGANDNFDSLYGLLGAAAEAPRTPA